MSPMSPRILRPRQTLHPDAAAWAARVVSNGGSVTGTTLSAVSKFCASIASAGLRDRFYRLNLFCGTGLNACLVPLYRGPSLGGTQYGGATDTNVGGLFVAGDYAETTGLNPGASNTSKYLETGYPANTLAANNTHLGAGLLTAESRTGDRNIMGALAGSNALAISARTAGVSNRAACMTRYGTVTDTFGPDVGTGGANLGSGNIVAAWPTMYRNGVAIGTDATTSANFPNTTTILVFTLNNSGVQQLGHINARMGWYSIGQTMTAAQAISFNNAINAFYSQIGRA